MSDLLKGGMDTLILGLLDAQPDHGYSVKLRLVESGIFVTDGALYPALHRLERGRYICGRWRRDPEKRKGERRRKIFSLTPLGREHLDDMRSQWETYATVFRRIVGVA